MRFCNAFGVPEKPVFTRLFRVFATAMLTNFQEKIQKKAASSGERRDRRGMKPPDEMPLCISKNSQTIVNATIVPYFPWIVKSNFQSVL